jgi:cytochrome c
MPWIAAELVLFAALLCLCGCGKASVNYLTSGDPNRGRAAIIRYGCGSCHTVGGIPVAHGQVGPPLTGIADRTYVAGMLQNTPENVERWIMHPKTINEKTAMPEMGVTSEDATHIVAYLYTNK